MHAGLDEQGEMSIGTQPPIGHQYIPFLQARMDRLHPGGRAGCARVGAAADELLAGRP